MIPAALLVCVSAIGPHPAFAEELVMRYGEELVETVPVPEGDGFLELWADETDGSWTVIRHWTDAGRACGTASGWGYKRRST